MNNRNKILILLVTIAALTGCKKYLEVQPEASYTENQVYGNEVALQQALNGLYLDMASSSLYGSYLTHTAVELLAQRYMPIRDLQATRDLSVLNNYQYQSPAAQTVFDSLWRKGYSVILSTNVFLSKIDGSVANRVISQANGRMLKGEAIAIRAMIHFDLLRLFGPMPGANVSAPSIPYYTLADAALQPLSTAAEVITKVIEDLNTAAELLWADPVTTTGVVANNDFYSGLRNQRLNYYAVKALLARAYLWQGNMPNANAAAKQIVEEAETKFPWTSYDAANSLVNPDRIFSSELLFALYNPALYTHYNLYYSPAQSDESLLHPDSTRLNEVYEGNLNDYRYSVSWKREGKSYPTLFKYADLTVPSLSWRFLQPLIRKSEMYFILAETESDAGAALEYLNIARRRRGLVSLEPGADIQAELRKEYQKEFFGEGQLFYYYKRINATDVPSAEYPYPWFTVTPTYVVPLPLSETSTR